MYQAYAFTKTHRDIYMVTLKGRQNFTSGQGHVVTQVDHIEHEPMRPDWRNAMGPFSCLYLFSITSYWQKKKLLVTSGDLRWSFEGWPFVFIVIDENWHLDHHCWQKTIYFRLNGNVPMRIRGSWNFVLWLIMSRSQNWPDLTAPIYKIRNIEVV